MKRPFDGLSRPITADMVFDALCEGWTVEQISMCLLSLHDKRDALWLATIERLFEALSRNITVDAEGAGYERLELVGDAAVVATWREGGEVFKGLFGAQGAIVLVPKRKRENG